MAPPAAVNLTYTNVVGDVGERLDRLFQKKNCLIEINPGKVLLPTSFKRIGQDILDLPVLENDVWLCSYPRTGSTWAQEMVWLIGHDLDYEGAKKIQQIRCPLLELTAIIAEDYELWHNQYVKETSVDMVRNDIPRPRYLRSHLPWGLLPTDLTNDDNSVKAKVIYTARSPKDMCVSFYHYCELVHNLKGSFDEFSELFLQGNVPVGPVWSHILGFWERKDDPNVLFIKFEEMKRDLPAIIRKTAAFLGKTLTDSDIVTLCEHLSFENMKKNKAVNLEPLIEKSSGKEFLENTSLRFIRKGEIGDWKNYMTEDTAKKFDIWVEENLRDTGLNFD